MTDSDVVFPARAGMIPDYFYTGYFGCSIPRESGDDPQTRQLGIVPQSYSPRERG